MKKELMIFDATNLMFRSFFGSQKLNLKNKEGEHTGAMFFFLRSINKLKKDYGVKKMIFCFDTKTSKDRRKKILKKYKENREYSEEMLPLFDQIEKIQVLLKDAGYDVFAEPDLEADDAVYILSENMKNDYDKIYLISNDKDYYQMIDDNVSIIRFDFKGQLYEYGKSDFVGEYGDISSEQFLDLKCICGDGSDNVIGIHKLGIKGTFKILDEFGSIEKWLSNKDYEYSIKFLPKWIREDIYEEIENVEKDWYNVIIHEEEIEGQEDITFTLKELLEKNREVLGLYYKEDEKFFPTSLFKVKRNEDNVCEFLDKYNIKNSSI